MIIKKTSILVVAYNAEKYIKNTLLSCINQTYKNVEILILDNASSDGTVAIIESFKDERIKLFKNSTNIGPYAGLNFLLKKAEGEYIAIQDHDDIWFPKKTEKQVNFLEKNQDFIACGTNTFYYYESEKFLILNKKPELAKFVYHTSLLFRNKGFRYVTNYNFPEEHFEENILSKEGKIGCIQEGLTVHRIRSDGKNLSELRFKKSVSVIIEVLKRNCFSIESVKYAIYILSINILPKRLIWFIRKKFTHKDKIKLNDFKNIYHNIEL